MKSPLEYTVAVAEPAPDEAEGEYHRAQSLEEERDPGYLTDQPQSVARRVDVPELLAGSKQAPKTHPPPNQQGTQSREGHNP